MTRRHINCTLSAILPAVLALTIASEVRAQDFAFSATYEVSIPTGDLRDFVDDTSWRGFGLGYSKRLDNDRIFAGISFGWHVLDGRTNETTQIPNGAVTGTQRRWVNVLPIMAQGQYFFAETMRAKPFVGFGLGATYSEETLRIGVFEYEESNWHFGISPEAGVQVPMAYALDLVLKARYNHAFKAGQGISGDEVEYAYFSIGVGIVHLGW